MQLLTQPLYRAALPLFAGIENNLMVRSMAAGHTPGFLWADDPAHPRAALAWNGLDWLFLAGAPAPALAAEARTLLETEIIPGLRRYAIPAAELFYDPAGWPPLLESTVLRGLNPTPFRVLSFTLETPAPAAPPPGFRLVPIDADLLARADRPNQPQVTGWVLSFWHSFKDFLRDGYGYCLLDGETVAAWCLVVFTDGTEDELALETAAPYRGRGLATAAASACVAHALARGRAPIWHCNESNPASVAVARKAGFRPSGAVAAYRFSPPGA